jgi:hypothetical protein
MVCLQKTGRGVYDSERQAKLWLDAAAPDVEPVTPEPVEVLTAPSAPVDGDVVDALARAIVRSFNGSSRGYRGNRQLCAGEDQFREYLTADGVAFDDQVLSAALTKLETATVSGSDARIVRGAELHRRNGSRWLPSTPLPARGMLLETVWQFDSMEYERGTSSPI